MIMTHKRKLQKLTEKLVKAGSEGKTFDEIMEHLTWKERKLVVKCFKNVSKNL